LFLFLEALCLLSWHTCLFICSWRHCVCLFVFYCHYLYHHLWLVISMVCLGNVVVKGNKLGLVGNVCASSFVVCSWNRYFYHVAFGWWC
jgi:energy-converting hydrogenase Eha subunit G